MLDMLAASFKQSLFSVDVGVRMSVWPHLWC